MHDLLSMIMVEKGYYYCFLLETKHENDQSTQNDTLQLDTDKGDPWRKVKLIFAEL